jgi:uncharacterized coiled-coil protein SlyX
MWRGIAIGTGLALLLVGGVSGQGQRSSATLDDLLTEIRGLRTDIGQSSSASLRAQLLIARLSLQEQRITALAGQLAEAQRRIGSRNADPESPVIRLKRFEEAVQARTAPPDAANAMEQMLPRLQEEAAIWQREEQALRTQENELAALFATEQNRWTDFNSRLDELERALAR